ncbi:MAG: hypothetical protein HY518_01155 [Candidatus Aenigmarchaeota archaeon]|nr:hypothetical protein [Candidatus Aenigmarchaeota archaeon]
MSEVPITRWSYALKGFISGSLVVLGLVSPVFIVFQLALALLGIVILVDACLRYGEVHIFTTVLAAAISGMAAFVFHLAGYSTHYLILIVAVAFLAYLTVFRRKD